MKARKSGSALLPVVMALGCAAAWTAGCSGPATSEHRIESPGRAALSSQQVPAAEAAADQSHPPSAPAPMERKPATGSEVKGKVAAIFGPAVKDGGGYAVGDFNGDGVEDLAVVVRPAAEGLARINSSVSSWILKDAQPPPLDAGQRPAPVQAERTDLLLAIIHGYGQTGWRDESARQTYLLRHASGDAMQPRPLEELMPVPAGRKSPGEVLVQTLQGRRGFLFWTGATYLWHPL